jgi:hypothetical protein
MMKRFVRATVLFGVMVLVGLALPQVSFADEKAIHEDSVTDEIRATGLIPPDEGQKAWMRENMYHVKKVHLNEIGLKRVEEAAKARGKKFKKPKKALPHGRELDLEIPGRKSIRAGTEAGEAAVGSTEGEGGDVSAGEVGAESTDGEGETVVGAGDLPASVNNSTLKYFPPIRNQGKVGSCAQFSSVYYTLTHMTALARDWNAKSGGDSYRFSPSWTYNTVAVSASTGSWFMWSRLQASGCARWSDFPYTENYKVWSRNGDVWKSALNYRCNETFQVSNLNATDNTIALNDLKTLLNNGYILNYATYVNSWSWTTIKDDPSTTADDAYVGKGIVRYVTTTKDGGHGMTIVGYNDTIWCDVNGNGIVDAGEKGAIRVANSWGTGWKESGYGWISYDSLRTVSAVSGAPSTREGLFWYGQAYGIHAKPSYTPRKIAMFTLNAKKRNQIYVTLGTSDLTKTSPTTTFNPRYLQGDGQAYAFDGTTTACDGTFAFDFTDIVNSGASKQRYYLSVRDSTTGDPVTVKEVKVLDGISSRATYTVTAIPASVDANTVLFYADQDYTISNTTPVANPQSVTTAEDLAKAITLTGSDADGDPLKFVIVTQPTKGTLSGTAPNVTYTPSANYNGSDSFTFKANDGGLDSASVTVSITVTPVNDAPVANAQSVFTSKDTAKAITLTGSDVDGDVLTYAIVTGPAHGTLSGTGATRTYTPNAGYFGSDSFTFKVNDGTVDSAAATVSIRVNAPPAANAGPDQAVTTGTVQFWTPAMIGSVAAWYDAADSSTITLASGVVSQWSDKSGNERHIAQATSTQRPGYTSGTSVNFDGSNDILFNKKSFMYASGSVDIYFVAAVNGASYDRRLIAESRSTSDSPLYAPVQSRNADDASRMAAYIRNDAGSILLANTVNLSATGAFNLATRKLYQMRDTGSQLSGRVNGGTTTSGSYTRSGTMTMDSFGIGGIPPRPSYSTGAWWTRADMNEVVIVPSVLSDEDRQKLEGYLAHKWGMQANLPSGHPYKDAAPLTDGGSGDTALVTLDGSGSTDLDGTIASYAWTLDGSQIASGASPMIVLGVGVHNVTLAVTDNDGVADTDTVVITVTDGEEPPPPVNTAPVANDQSVTTAEDTAKAITLAGSDADGDPLTYAIVIAPANGTLSGTAPNVTYTPAANYSGSDSFSFKANDGTVDSAAAMVSITVTAVNDAPVADAQSVTTAEDTAKAITLTGSDVDGDPLTYAIVSGPANGTLSGTAPNVTYTPAANYSGSDSFTFKGDHAYRQ